MVSHYWKALFFFSKRGYLEISKFKINRPVNGIKSRRSILPMAFSVRFGCAIEREVYRSRGRGRMTLPQYEMWLETFTAPEKGYNKINITCPICRGHFEVKVHSLSRARLRKLYFASCFLTIAACAGVFGILAPGEKSFLGYGLAAPFVYFAVWQLFNVFRGRFDASDIVSHSQGKVHRIFDERKIEFSSGNGTGNSPLKIKKHLFWQSMIFFTCELSSTDCDTQQNRFI